MPPRNPCQSNLLDPNRAADKNTHTHTCVSVCGCAHVGLLTFCLCLVDLRGVDTVAVDTHGVGRTAHPPALKVDSLPSHTHTHPSAAVCGWVCGGGMEQAVGCVVLW